MGVCICVGVRILCTTERERAHRRARAHVCGPRVIVIGFLPISRTSSPEHAAEMERFTGRTPTVTDRQCCHVGALPAFDTTTAGGEHHAHTLPVFSRRPHAQCDRLPNTRKTPRQLSIDRSSSVCITTASF